MSIANRFLLAVMAAIIGIAMQPEYKDLPFSVLISILGFFWSKISTKSTAALSPVTTKKKGIKMCPNCSVPMYCNSPDTEYCCCKKCYSSKKCGHECMDDVKVSADSEDALEYGRLHINKISTPEKILDGRWTVDKTELDTKATDKKRKRDALKASLLSGKYELCVNEVEMFIIPSDAKLHLKKKKAESDLLTSKKCRTSWNGLKPKYFLLSFIMMLLCCADASVPKVEVKLDSEDNTCEAFISQEEYSSFGGNIDECCGTQPQCCPGMFVFDTDHWYRALAFDEVAVGRSVLVKSLPSIPINVDKVCVYGLKKCPPFARSPNKAKTYRITFDAPGPDAIGCEDYDECLKLAGECNRDIKPDSETVFNRLKRTLSSTDMPCQVNIGYQSLFESYVWKSTDDKVFTAPKRLFRISCKDGDRGVLFGTSDGESAFYTAMHVLESQKNCRACRGSNCYDISGWKSTGEGDVALVNVTIPSYIGYDVAPDSAITGSCFVASMTPSNNGFVATATISVEGGIVVVRAKGWDKGMSGGPLLCDSKVIGVVSGKYSSWNPWNPETLEVFTLDGKDLAMSSLELT